VVPRALPWAVTVSPVGATRRVHGACVSPQLAISAPCIGSRANGTHGDSPGQRPGDCQRKNRFAPTGQPVSGTSLNGRSAQIVQSPRADTVCPVGAREDYGTWFPGRCPGLSPQAPLGQPDAFMTRTSDKAKCQCPDLPAATRKSIPLRRGHVPTAYTVIAKGNALGIANARTDLPQRGNLCRGHR